MLTSKAMVRNLLITVGALFVGLMVMQPFMAFDSFFSEGRSFPGTSGWLLLHAISLLPSVAGASVFAATVAAAIKTQRPSVWASIVAAIIAVLLLAATVFVAPVWQAWVGAALHVIVPTLLAWVVFLVVWGRRMKRRAA